MEGVNVPLGFLSRVWSAIRANPCKIEVLDNYKLEGFPWLRIRNDSPLPTYLVSVKVRIKFVGISEPQLAYTPIDWIAGENMKIDGMKLEPGDWFELPFDPDEIHDFENRQSSIEKYVVLVYHRRHNRPVIRKISKERVEKSRTHFP